MKDNHNTFLTGVWSQQGKTCQISSCVSGGLVGFKFPHVCSLIVTCKKNSKRVFNQAEPIVLVLSIMPIL